jgi:hypothetical protein
MQAREYTIEQVAASGERAVRALNKGMELPRVIVRFMAKMFGGGGYPLQRLSSGEWCFTTGLAHYRIRIIDEETAMVRGWTKRPKGSRVAYEKIAPSVHWKIRLGDWA